MTKAWEISGSTGMVRPKQAETVSKKMLDIELFVYGETLLVGRVLYQDESLRGDGVTQKHIYTGTDFRVDSYASPEMTVPTLYIKGSKHEDDNKPMYWKFTSTDVLKKYVCNVKKALAEINKTSKLTTEDSGVFKRVL